LSKIISTFSRESDKTNKEKLKATLHTLEKEMEVIEQKRQALMKENLASSNFLTLFDRLLVGA
jgi:hypothetical protein